LQKLKSNVFFFALLAIPPPGHEERKMAEKKKNQEGVNEDIIILTQDEPGQKNQDEKDMNKESEINVMQIVTAAIQAGLTASPMTRGRRSQDAIDKAKKGENDYINGLALDKDMQVLVIQSIEDERQKEKYWKNYSKDEAIKVKQVSVNKGFTETEKWELNKKRIVSQLLNLTESQRKEIYARVCNKDKYDKIDKYEVMLLQAKATGDDDVVSLVLSRLEVAKKEVNEE